MAAAVAVAAAVGAAVAAVAVAGGEFGGGESIELNLTRHWKERFELC